MQMPKDYDPDSLTLTQQIGLRQQEFNMEKMSPDQLKQVALYASFKYYQVINGMIELQKQTILKGMP